jgi:hypothetical protein
LGGCDVEKCVGRDNLGYGIRDTGYALTAFPCFYFTFMPTLAWIENKYLALGICDSFLGG